MTRAVSIQNAASRPGRKAVLAVAVVAAGVLSAGTARAGDAATGKALALQWCSACHVVADDQATASSVSLPSFFDMAKDPGWSQEKLATFLANPHPQMPNMTLGNTEIANLAAYIGSLAP
ncbi:c-type cytochrome [Roseibium sp. Sym1]|uniref:c-type cytochrome n=1 Tax=Roseibium sp. Sym1 TaxID=3016006 RepID=UPI0022B4F2CC|nr:c-type cytochrome [Roseibium sp. Sym1]